MNTKKPFIVANVRDIIDLYDKEEIGFSKVVQLLNEVADRFYNPDEKIILSKYEYTELIKYSQKLSYLQSWGVDNWEGYDLAMKDYRKWEEEEINEE